MGRPILGTARIAGLALVAAAVAAPAAGQGSSVYNHSACISARGGAAVASPCADGSSAYYNPGALAFTPSVITAGLNAIINEGSFTYDEGGREIERETTAPIVPHAYANVRFGDDQRWAAGLGFWAPYGLGIEWPEDFEGKYISWKTRLRGLYLQPTIAYQLIPGKLSIGAGPQIVFGGLEINQTLDGATTIPLPGGLSLPLGTDVARVTLEGSGTGYGAAVGLHYQASERFALGARYMHSVEVELDGDADFTQLSNPQIALPVGPGGALVPLDAVLAVNETFQAAVTDQDISATLEFPAQAVVGFRFGATPELAFMADYQWTGWSSFDRIIGDFAIEGVDDLELTLNYEDSHTFRFGSTLEAAEGFQLRGGFIYNTAATPDETVTAILPEAERQLYTIGFGYDMGPLRADAYYNYVNQADRRGRVRSELPGPFTLDDLNIGVYSTTAHLVGLTLVYTFGDVR